MKRLPLLLLLTVILALACNLPLTAAPPTATPAPLPTATLVPPTAAPVPLWQQVTLTDSVSAEEHQAPDFTITTHLPVLQGSDDPRVRAFNDAVAALVLNEAETFRSGWINDLPAEPFSSGSFLESGYTLLSPPGPVLSLLFSFFFYSDGAAHPNGYTIAYTYDLEAGRALALADLFTPGADYLAVIAAYCKTDLSARNMGFDDGFSQGADPTPENYRNWNITPEGLRITFDAYQVAPYASGPQVVTIPYAELSSLLRADGPLGPLMP